MALFTVPRRDGSATDAKPLDHGLVATCVGPLEIIEQLAALRGTDALAVGRQTDRNFDRLFKP